MYTLSRNIPIEKEYDLIVAGGGMGGASAAICAARLGLRVLLCEGMGCLGGMGTSGLVCSFDPMSDGRQMLVGGLMREIVETLYNRGSLGYDVTPKDYTESLFTWIPFDPEALKELLDELCLKAGVEIRYFTRVVDVDRDGGHLNGVIINNVEGFSFIPAKMFVDGTGDAVLSKLSGVGIREAGTDTKHIMPASLTGIMTGVDWDEFKKTQYSIGNCELVEMAYRDGILSQEDRHLVGLFRLGKDSAYMNTGHIFDLNSANTASLTAGMIQGRRQLHEYLNLYKKYHKGFENAQIVATGTLMGVRESRRIVGEYELNIDNYIHHRQFPDQIGIFDKFIDIHPYDCSKEEYLRFCEESHGRLKYKEGEYFGIPYGITVPKGYDNLWVAGRCNSSDVQLHGAIRVMPACAMMGQAVAAAAYLSMEEKKGAAQINTASLVQLLREQGANLPQNELSATMTKSTGE